MSKQELELACAPTGASLREAARVIDRMASAVCMLTRDDGVLAGVLTDGDFRRALLNGASLDDAALQYATDSPQTVGAGSPRSMVLDLMRALRISAVPEIDKDGRVLGLHTLSDVVGVSPLPHVAVIMAGGRGTRLGHLTTNTPKPLLTVAGRPIIEWIILNLVGDGIREIFVSVNHFAEQIEERLGDGRGFGCTIRYLREDPDKPLGTAGSLSLLASERPDMTHPVVVMNGDLMVQFSVQQLLDDHAKTGARATVAIRSYQHEVPFGVVEWRDGQVTEIAEKPTLSVDINAAVYALDADVLSLVPPAQPSTMPELLQRCLEEQMTVSPWRLTSDWIDVGTPSDLARAKGQV